MQDRYEEWVGQGSNKFPTSKKIVEPVRNEVQVKGLLGDSNDGVAPVKGRRHYEQKQSGFVPDWKPSIRVIGPQYGDGNMKKITDIPCTIKRKRPRNLPQIPKYTTTIKKQPQPQVELTDEELVRSLDAWEDTVLKRTQQQLSKANSMLFRSSADTIRSMRLQLI